LQTKRKSKKTRPTSVPITKKRSGGGFLGFGYARCWAINKPTRIEDESDKIDPNRANTFPRRSTKDLMIILI
jgi:hypothetical protein